MNYNFMKGGMEFVDDNFTEIGKLKLDGENEQNYTKKYVKTHSKIKDDTPLKFTLYNIESFNKYSETEKFELSNLINDFDNIEHIFLCGFLTKLTRKELFIKKNIQNNNKENYKEIGRILYDIYNNKKESEKIQIILVHSSDYNALYIIFNMSNINSIYYDMLKNNLSTELFSDKKKLMRKVTNTQLESFIDFTNKKLNIESTATEADTKQEENKENKLAIEPKNKTEFLLKLLFKNKTDFTNKKFNIETTATEADTKQEENKENKLAIEPKNKTEFLLKLLFKNKTELTDKKLNIEPKVTEPKNKTKFLLKLFLRANEKGNV